MAKYPVYIEMANRKVVIIGAGSVASRKAKTLFQAGADVLVIAKEIQPEFTKRCDGLNIEIIQTEYSRNYLSNATLVIAATNINELNSRVYSDCNELGILCNVVDVPELCDFYVPAIMQQGPLQIAIGTDGNSPSYAGKIKRQLKDIYTEQHGQFIELLGAMRKQLIPKIPDIKIRKKIFMAFISNDSFNCFVKEGKDAWLKFAEQIVQRETQNEN